MRGERYCRHVECVLLTHPAVADCAVLERRTERGESELVAYVVPAAPCTTDDLSALLRSASDLSVGPYTFSLVSSIPLTPEGDVDNARLASLPIVDGTLLDRWRELLKSSTEVERAAAIVQEGTSRAWPLHISDLLLDRDQVRSAPVVEERPHSALFDNETRISAVPAIADGGPLLLGSDAPVLLGDALRRAAAVNPNEQVVCIETDGSERRRTYAELLKCAECTLSGLRTAGLTPGDRVVLQLERHHDFMEVFWACVLGGFVPVPVAVPPHYDRPGGSLETLRGAWPVLGAAALVTERRAVADLSAAITRLGLCARIHAVEELRDEPDTRHHIALPDQLALLMLTSGSTGVPKAVMLTHRNLLMRSAASQHFNGFTNSDVTLNWMPLDHVAGLIYFHVRDVYLACRQVHVPTSTILQEPPKWLEYLERYKATITFAPNFAFGLINECEAHLAEHQLDLSSVRFVLNGAESIVPKTARTFLRLLASHGLASNCMRPAWGMSETSSGVTYNDSFSLASSSDQDAFVEVGRPIPGFAMRIVDAHDRLVDEGATGRLQVRGTMVTRGYFNSPELTQDSFTPDGWFITGDLGVIQDGRLTITGREKDVVIVNSVNYYCHVIESVVEEVDGVERSYTAACAVRRSDADTDGLAIFFHPRSSDANALAELLLRIRSEVITRVGISPDYLVPVDAAAIPKTSVGKIQRVELGRRLLAGEFDEPVKHADRLLGNANTIPDWFYRKVWRRKSGIASDEGFVGQVVLVFSDRAGLGDELCRLFEAQGGRCIRVSAAVAFARTDVREYCLNPRLASDYVQLVTALAEAGDLPAHVVHLWTYAPYEGAAGVHEIDLAQDLGALSALWLVKALGAVPGDSHRIRMTFVGSHVQRVLAEDTIAYERSPLLGVVKSLPQETSWLQCRHVDLHEHGAAVAARLVVEEIAILHSDREVAYRNGQRFVARLQRVAFRPESRKTPHFTPGGMYLISGGAGGIGERISSCLLERYGAHLLVIGRRDSQSGPASVLARLARLGGTVAYESADVCDHSRIAELVTRYESLWGQRLHGIIHLAGTYHECPLLSENAESFREALRAKTIGTHVLHQILAARGAGLFVSSSSLAGFFGGANIAAYSSANAFQEAFASHTHGHGGVEHYCFSWSNWEGVGQSRAYQMKELQRARGYRSMVPEHAVQSLLIGLTFRESALLIGLDAGHRYVRRYLDNDADTLKKIVVYYAPLSSSASEAPFRQMEPRDRFGVMFRPDIVRVREMPMTHSGEIDESALARLAGGSSRGARDAAPRNDLERRVIEIWKRVLAVPEVGIEDNFFDLGGDSLQALRLIARVREECSAELRVRDVFDAGTLVDLVAIIAARGGTTAASAPDRTAAATEVVDPRNLLARVEEMTDSEVDALMNQLSDHPVADV